MKHNLFLIILIFLISIFSLKAQSINWEIILNEQFDNNNNKWTTSNTEERKASVISGKLIDEYNKDGYIISNTIPTNFDNTKDYRIKFSIANLNYGYKVKRENIFPVYGFVWSFKDWKNYNFILFQQGYHSNGYSSKLVTYYKIGSYIDGNEIVHNDWEKGNLLSELKTESSFNEITMVKLGGRISFYYGNCSWDFQYDGRYLGYCSSEKWFSNRCGIYVSGGSKIVLDYLTIEQEKPKVNSLISDFDMPYSDIRTMVEKISEQQDSISIWIKTSSDGTRKIHIEDSRVSGLQNDEYDFCLNFSKLVFKYMFEWVNYSREISINTNDLTYAMIKKSIIGIEFKTEFRTHEFSWEKITTE